jgi:hypothetical protein
MEALGLGEFARVAVAHSIHIFWIVHTAKHSRTRRLGCDELNTTYGLVRE